MRNAVKSAAAKGNFIRGIHLTFAQPTVVEILATTEIDFLYIDGEHGAFGIRDIEACCVAAELVGMTTIARVPDRSAAAITQFLDRGINGIVVPHVESVADAAEVVNAAYYGPVGQRSYGGGRPAYGLGIGNRVAYLAECNASMSVGIMIESGDGLSAAGEIAALDGVDYLSFGLNDLAQSLGFTGQPDHPQVVDAVREASERIRRAGKPVREDFMKFAWINDVIVAGTKALVG